MISWRVISLKKAKRFDLIGTGKNCLVAPEKPLKTVKKPLKTAKKTLKTRKNTPKKRKK